MARSGSERRRLTSKPVGVRLSEEREAVLTSLALEHGVSKATYLRQVFDAHLAGQPSRRAAVLRHVMAAEDRIAFATFSRHAGQLTGALIQTAKTARQCGGMASYHGAVEYLLAEVKDLKRRVDNIAKVHER